MLPAQIHLTLPTWVHDLDTGLAGRAAATGRAPNPGPFAILFRKRSAPSTRMDSAATPTPIAHAGSGLRSSVPASLVERR